MPNQKIVSAAKTECRRCGAGILQITADLTDGHCMPCADALAREKRPVPEYVKRRNPEPLLDHCNPGEGVILSIAYHPGFTPDLTSWTIQISLDGVLQQAVDWHRRAGPRKEELLDPARLNAPQLAELQRVIERCEGDAFKSLKRTMCVDDAALVSLVIPYKQIKTSLPYFHFRHDIRKGRLQLDDAQQSAFAQFEQLWGLVDRFAPYSLRQHEQARRNWRG